MAYIRHEGGLLIGTPFGWARNMRTGEPVEIILQGKRRQADVRVISDEDGVVAAYDVVCHALNRVRVRQVQQRQHWPGRRYRPPAISTRLQGQPAPVPTSCRPAEDHHAWASQPTWD